MDEQKRSEAHRALAVVRRVDSFCDFIEHPAMIEAVKAIPVSMPADLGSLGFDDISIGLGIVGLWAALDAFAERAALPRVECPICRGWTCIFQRFGNVAREPDALKELEDLRHLYAHNYAGEVDEVYEKFPMRRHGRRHVLLRDKPTPLTVGAQFDGQSVRLNVTHLRRYVAVVRGVLEAYR